MTAFENEYSPGTMLFDKTLESALPAMMAVTEADIIRLNLSVPDAVTTVLGMQSALPISKYRIAATLQRRNAICRRSSTSTRSP